jgi:hypothetical protein
LRFSSFSNSRTASFVSLATVMVTMAIDRTISVNASFSLRVFSAMFWTCWAV